MWNGFVVTRFTRCNVCDQDILSRCLQICGQVSSDKTITTDNYMFHFDTCLDIFNCGARFVQSHQLMDIRTVPAQISVMPAMRIAPTSSPNTK